MKELILFFINDLCYFIKGCPNETLSNISFIQKLQKSKGVYVIKDVVLDEIKKELNWKERIVLKLFKRLMKKVYNISRINTVNKFIK